MKVMRFAVYVRICAIVASGLGLSACVTFSTDKGLGDVAGIVQQDLKKNIAFVQSEGEAAQLRRRVESLLKKTLTVDTAVQIALLNNRGLQAAYNELAIAEAVRVGSSLPPNPRFSILRIASGLETEVETQIVTNVLALATIPIRADIAADRFRQAQLHAAEETLRVAAEARRAYYRAVAARELVRLLSQAKSAAESTAQVARELGKTGALNKLDQAREQAFYAETTAELAMARENESSEHEKLVRVLGLWGKDTNLKLPWVLPALPFRPLNLPDVEVDAVRKRLDLQVARTELAALAKSYGLTHATRFVSLLEAGPAFKTTRDREKGEAVRDSGVDVEFEIPIFDFGETRIRQAEQTYLKAVNRLLQLAVNVRSEAREAYQGYRSTYDVAQHYQREILPLHNIINEQMQLQYSAMQSDVFALLAEARQRIAANRAAIAAKLAFWLASSRLREAIYGGARSAEPETEAPVPIVQTAAVNANHD
ncbi:MAG: TolC family protein [Pseudolabrys sp.]|nr:TolC family protein [Pseudolabrys sp.]